MMMHLNDRILAVDDNQDNLDILQEILAEEFTFMGVSCGEEALRMSPQFAPDLVLLDVMMPGIDGVDTCRALRQLPELKGSRIVMLSAKNRLTDRLAAYDVGAVDYIAKPFDHYEVVSKVRAWMQMVHKEQLDEIWRATDKAEAAVGAAMLNLASFRDTETGDHLFRVRWYAQTLADELSRSGPYRTLIDAEFRESFYRATPLHDIGKVAIGDAVLRKPGKLTPDEFEAMKSHTVIGHAILRSAFRKMPTAKYLEMAAEIARHHHERFDGSGYPDELAGNLIPLAARILTVADVFDALTTKRVYKEAVSVSDAATAIAAGVERQFDPMIVEAFERRLAEFRQAHSRFTTRCAMYDGALTSFRPDLNNPNRPNWFLDTFSTSAAEQPREELLTAPIV